MPHQVARWRHLARKGKDLLLCGKDLVREPVYEKRVIEDKEEKTEISISGGEAIAIGATRKENVVITKPDAYGAPTIIGRGQNVLTYTGASEPSYQYYRSIFVVDKGHEEEKEVTKWENGEWHTYKITVTVGQRSIPSYEAQANITYYYEYKRAGGAVSKGESRMTAYATYVSYDGGLSYELHSNREESLSSGTAPNYTKVKAQSPVVLTFTKKEETTTRDALVAVDDDDNY